MLDVVEEEAALTEANAWLFSITFITTGVRLRWQEVLYDSAARHRNSKEGAQQVRI